MNSHGAQKKALGLKPAPSYNLRCLYGHVLPGLDIFLGWDAPQNTIPHIYDTNANCAGLDQKVCSVSSYNLRCLYGHVLPRLEGLDIFLGWHGPQNTIPHIYDTNANFSGLDQKVCSAPIYNLRCLYGHVVPWLEFPWLDIFLGWDAPQNTIPHIYDTNANYFE